MRLLEDFLKACDTSLDETMCLDEACEKELKEDINNIGDAFIKIYKSSDSILEDAWDFPIEELDYLLEEHPGESFVLSNGRLWEIAESDN